MIYITGSSGFIGKHLAPLLGDATCVSHAHIQPTNFSSARRVFFLSTYGNMASHEDINETVEANVVDLCHVLSTINWSKIESFVFISTSSVKLRVQTAYSRTKKAAEEILLAYMEKYGAPITIIRPLSVTGPGEQEAHLIPTLIRSCQTGEFMQFVETPAHDFIDVRDLVAGIKSLSDNRVRGIFELGTGISYTNAQVRTMVERITGREANAAVVGSLRDYDTDRWVSNNFKSRSWGWMPTITLEQSVEDMINAK